MFPDNKIDTSPAIREPSEPYMVTARMIGPLSEQEFVELPMLDARAMGSFSDNIYGQMYQLVTGQTYPVLKESGVNYEKALVMNITGNSMFPYFRDGMKVIVRELPPGRWATATGIHAISTKDGMFTVKLITSNRNNVLTLKATNPDTPEEFTVQMADILIMFRVGEIVYAPPVQDI